MLNLGHRAIWCEVSCNCVVCDSGKTLKRAVMGMDYLFLELCSTICAAFSATGMRVEHRSVDISRCTNLTNPSP